MTDQLQFTAARRELVQALTFAATGLPRRPVVPVLAGMRLEVTAGKVTMAGFDYEMTAQTSVPATGTVAGVALPRGHELLKAVKSLPGKPATPVTVTATGHGLRLTASGVTATVELLPMTDYPELPAMPAEAGIMDSGAFVAAVQRVVRAAGTDDTLPILTTVLLDMAPEALRMVTTDRYRLATDVPAWTAGDAMESRKANIPARELAAFAGKVARDGKVSIHLDDTRDGFAGFSDGTRSMIIHTMAGEFIRYESILRMTGDAASAMVEAPALAAAVKRAGGQCERNMPVTLQFTPDSVTVTTTRDGEVSYSESVPVSLEVRDGADGITAEGWTVAYNPAYLGSMLAGVDGLAILSWATPGKPVMVRPADDSARYLALVMPIRLAG